MKKQTIHGDWKTFPYLILMKVKGVFEVHNGETWVELNDEQKNMVEKNDFFEIFDNEHEELDHPHENPNLKCDCGSETFKVCWWNYPYAGGFCKVVCSECGKELILIDDYA